MGKDSRSTASSKSSEDIFEPTQPAAAKNSKDANSKPHVAVDLEDNHDVDVETLDEDNTELVTVEVTTVHRASSVNRSSSRKRKRTQQAEEIPAKSDGN